MGWKMVEKWKVPANYISEGRTLTGYLYFYKDFFLYKADSISGTLIFPKIPYSEIKEVKNVNTFGIIPNGLIVTTKDDQQYRFSVVNRNKVRLFLEDKADELQRK